MLMGDTEAIATIAVKDLEAAKKFYEGKLGLRPAAGQQPGSLEYKSGNSTLMVYVSRYAGTNKATAVTWSVGDQVEEIVKALKTKGVAFEHYDLPDTTRKGDVHVSGGMRLAWLKDPDGNILAIAGR